MKGQEVQAPFRYLNIRNPDIKAALCAHIAKIADGEAGTAQEDWDELERELMRRYLLSGYTPSYLYPFFIQVNLPQVRPLWEKYLLGIGHPAGTAPSDPERRVFERQIAAIVAEGRKQDVNEERLDYLRYLDNCNTWGWTPSEKGLKAFLHQRRKGWRDESGRIVWPEMKKENKSNGCIQFGDHVTDR